MSATSQKALYGFKLCTGNYSSPSNLSAVQQRFLFIVLFHALLSPGVNGIRLNGQNSAINDQKENTKHTIPSLEQLTMVITDVPLSFPD